MSRYALIKDDEVKSVIKADAIFVSKISASWDSVVNVDGKPEAKIGYSYDGENFTAPDNSLSEDEAWAEIRKQRDELIEAKEWMKSRHRDELDMGKVVDTDTSLSSAEWTALLDYVQELRDLPDNITDPVDWLAKSAWPTEPS